mmetsp:Transcript_106670/g.309406  ORF Transcript_106670/g.309406 Transcript_106670/m.309406 type:complete len:150 (+) Transcript_106670:200-649(+)
MSARVSRPPMLIIMNGQLTGYDQSANELSSNLNTVKFHFSLDNYHQLLRMKSSGATAGCPSDWMGTGIKFAVTFLGSGRATTMTGYGTDHPLEEGETAVTSQFVIKLSAHRSTCDPPLHHNNEWTTDRLRPERKRALLESQHGQVPLLA